jgi:hypothetical protein
MLFDLLDMMELRYQLLYGFMGTFKYISLPRTKLIFPSGSYASGGNLDQRYNLSFIIKASVEAETPMIGVAINYRLHGMTALF